MPEEEKEVQDVTEESSPQEDVETESSTEEQSEATEEQAVPESQVPYDRFKEVNEEKIYWRDKFAEQASKQPEVVEPDPNASLDPQTKLFYQDLDKRTQKAIEKARKEEREQYQAELNAVRMQSAKIQERIFRQDQTDVVAGSKDEIEIAGLIRMGMDPNKAAWAVMGPKRVESAKSGKVIKQQNKNKMKAQANIETSGVQEGSGLPAAETLDFRADLDRRMKEAGL